MVSESSDLFAGTLVLTFPHRDKRGWLTWPAAAALHLAIVLVFVMAPIFSPQELEPHRMVMFFNPAPPPPPPQRRGSPMVLQRETDTVPKPQPERVEPQQRKQVFVMEDKRTPTEIPDEILQPQFELQFGVEEGFELGDLAGMKGGVPGGVVGGVPGGIVGGVIGGTGTQVLPVHDVDPQAIRTPLPSYTVEAIRKKITGDVVLQAIIDVRGRVKITKVLRSIPELDEEAIRVVEEQWLFRPARKSGRPVPSLAVLVVTFNLY